MICKKCGKQVDEGINFCPICGNKMDNSIVILDEETDVSIPKKNKKNKASSKRNAPFPNVNKKRYNLGHLGVLFSSTLVLVSVFLKNTSGMYANGSVISSINSRGLVSGNSYAFILILCILFTLAMAYYKKNIFSIIGSIITFICIMIMLSNSGKTIFSGLGYMLFAFGGVLLVISSISSFVINRRKY